MNITVESESRKEMIKLKTIMHDDVIAIRNEIAHSVINLQDEAVKNALIKLGWTPPKEEAK